MSLISSNKAIFTWVSKVICGYFGFELLRLVNGLKKVAPLSQPIRTNTKINPKSNQNQSWIARERFPALRDIVSSSDWTMDCFASFVIDQSNQLCFLFSTLIWKLL